MSSFRRSTVRSWVMARNQRLHEVIRQDGRGLDDVAYEAGADPRTVGRWITSGRAAGSEGGQGRQRADPSAGGSGDENAQSPVGRWVPVANRRSPTTQCSFLAISSIPGLVSRGDGALAAGGRLTETPLAAGRAERGYRIFTSSVGERWKLDGGS